MAFAKGEDLARFTNAGRYEHNIKLIPIQFNALVYLIEKSTTNTLNKLDNENYSLMNQIFF